jgi:hypothetical protein
LEPFSQEAELKKSKAVCEQALSALPSRTAEIERILADAPGGREADEERANIQTLSALAGNLTAEKQWVSAVARLKAALDVAGEERRMRRKETGGIEALEGETSCLNG